MNTLGGELLSHLAAVVLLTLAIAPLVLWRYRHSVLGGMMARPGPTLAVAPPWLRPSKRCWPRPAHKVTNPIGSRRRHRRVAASMRE